MLAKRVARTSVNHPSAFVVARPSIHSSNVKNIGKEGKKIPCHLPTALSAISRDIWLHRVTRMSGESILEVEAAGCAVQSGIWQEIVPRP